MALSGKLKKKFTLCQTLKMNNIMELALTVKRGCLVLWAIQNLQVLSIT